MRAHLLNPIWHSKEKRRLKRNRLLQKRKTLYLQRYVPYMLALDGNPDLDSALKDSAEKAFTIWFQGEENAPKIVKRCIESQRLLSPLELVVLNESNIYDWISLPDYIVAKYRDGKIGRAHFADICRLELLYRYGGLWMDATDLIVSPVPDWIMNESFFVYMAGENILGAYSYIQNCFIRAKKGDRLLKMWRDSVFEYWRREERVVDYVIHHLIFKVLVENNPLARQLFEGMPKHIQDPTHTIWFRLKDKPFDEEEYRQLSNAACFQKTDYLSDASKNPVPGTYADYIINGKINSNG